MKNVQHLKDMRGYLIYVRGIIKDHESTTENDEE
jgi:hypothetical protein